MLELQRDNIEYIETQEASMDSDSLIEFLQSVPGGDNILVFLIGFSIPCLAVYILGSRLLPKLTDSVVNFSRTLNSLAKDISGLSNDISKTCTSIHEYSNNLRITSEKATAAFASINNGLVLTNQHIANLDTSLDVVKEAINSNTYTIDGVSGDVNEVKDDIKYLIRKPTL